MATAEAVSSIDSLLWPITMNRDCIDLDPTVLDFLIHEVSRADLHRN